MRLPLTLFWALGAAVLALADTEIRNIKFPLPGPALPLGLLPKGSPKLSPSESQLFNVSNTSSEQFVLLTWPEEPLADSSWTVRLSWPGSSPTKWKMDVSAVANQPHSAILYIKGEALSPRVPSIDWAGLRACLPRQLAFLNPLLDRIAPVSSPPQENDAGTQGGRAGLPEAVCELSNIPLFGTLFHRFTSLPILSSFAPERTTSSTPNAASFEAWKSEPWDTTFSIMLEPLYFGVLPKSSVPTLVAIVVFALGAWFVVPFIMRTLEGSTSMIEQKTWEAEEKAHREGKQKLKAE